MQAEDAFAALGSMQERVRDELAGARSARDIRGYATNSRDPSSLDRSG